MTLLIGKQCTDGVLFLADGISIREDLGLSATRVVTTGAVKAFCGKRGGEHYCLVFGGHAELNTRRPTIEWLKGAALNPEGRLQDNMEQAAREALRDAVANGFEKDEDEQRTKLWHDGHIFVFVSVRWNEWWSVEVFYG